MNPICLERLEDRTVPSIAAPTLDGQGNLGIVGAPGNDNVRVLVQGAQIVVRDASTLTAVNYLFDAARVATISFRGNDGNDTFACTALRPVTAFGGPGNDSLSGGGG